MAGAKEIKALRTMLEEQKRQMDIILLKVVQLEGVIHDMRQQARKRKPRSLR
jgi:hypothetical protein